jgi:phospholipid/cholesterol/gamma-HCH transport system permease protein
MAVSKGLSATEFVEARKRTRIYRSYSDYVGNKLIHLLGTLRGLSALLIITVAVAFTKYKTARQVVHPLVRKQMTRAGYHLLPMVVFLAIALGMVVIGQTVLILNRFGAQNYIGTVMVTVVVRELGPILAALLVLARVGTANVVELGMARACGEVEALEALGIDPIHYLVVPRVFGLAMAIFALTVYFILFALLSGFLFTFLEGVPLLPGQYFQQLASALLWQDFVLLALKTLAFGTFIAIATCYEGLAQPLRLEEVSRATAKAVAKCVVGVVLLDALFIIVYLVI